MQMSIFGERIKLSSESFMTYRGSKKAACKTILRCVPSGISEIISPFIGAGGFELKAAASGIKVFGYDNHVGLVRLWNSMLSDAGTVARKVLEDFPGDRRALSNLIKTGAIYDIDDDLEFAATAWKISKFSFSGNFLKFLWVHQSRSDNYVDKKFRSFFNPNKWDDWGNDNLRVEVSEWEQTLENHPDSFLYCDPPYVDCEYYYGVYGENPKFNHSKFADTMIARDNGWIISYIDNPLIRDLYKDFEIVNMSWHQPTLNVGDRKTTDNDEILIIKSPAVNPYSVMRI